MAAAGCTICILLLIRATISARVANFAYVGCYIDNTLNVRDLGGLIGIQKLGGFAIAGSGIYIFNNMTQELCGTVCSLGGFKYFGTQNGKECYCGNSYGSQGNAGSEAPCSSTCGGNPSKKCGGSARNSVFALSYPYSSYFIKDTRVGLDVGTYPNATHWSIGVFGLVECALRCDSDNCQAVIFDQQQGLCSMLRFAAVPTALASSVGDFYVRG